MRAFLHAHLIAGIKIVKTTRETFTLMTADDYQERIFRLNSNLLAKSEEIEEKDRRIGNFEQEKALAIDSVKQECAQEASQLQQRIREIENQVNNVNEELRKKLEELEKWKKLGEAFDDERKSHKEDKEELEQELNDERRRYLNERDKANRLEKEKEEASAKANKCNEELEALKLEKSRLEEDYRNKTQELEKCKGELSKKPDKTQPEKRPTPSLPVGCQLMLQLMNDPYSYDTKMRENG